MSFYISYDSIKKAGLLFFLLTQSMLIWAESATNPDVTAGSVDQDQYGKTNFPSWPVRQPVVKEIVPPPPPGPYMSLGLNDFPVSESSFESKANRPQIELDSSGVPIETFSPDAPWPKNIRPAKRWMPENGYQYVNPQIARQPYTAVQNNREYNYNYGYQRDPNIGWPGSKWAPSISPGPVAAYRYAPDYGSAYNNSANNNRIQPGNPNYRAPYPVPGKP
jgi:hypothetical protein